MRKALLLAAVILVLTLSACGNATTGDASDNAPPSPSTSLMDEMREESSVWEDVVVLFEEADVRLDEDGRIKVDKWNVTRHRICIRK